MNPKYFNFNDDEDGSITHVLYNKDNGEAIGTFSVFKTEYNDEIISRFKINDEYQRKGYGDLLLSEYLKTKKNVNIYLHVYSNNIKAINFYKKHGFENYEDVFITTKRYQPKQPTTGYIIQMKTLH